MLEPACCIRLATSFDTFQQRPTMLDPLPRPVWVNEKILEILIQRDSSIIRNLKNLARFYNDFKEIMLPGNKVSRI